MALNATDWTIGDVSLWLEDEGLGRHRRQFEANGVDGETIVFHLTCADLRDELHIASLLDRKKVWNAVQRLRQELIMANEEPPRPRWTPEPLDPIVDSICGSPARYDATPVKQTTQRPASAPPSRAHQLAPLHEREKQPMTPVGTRSAQDPLRSPDPPPDAFRQAKKQPKTKPQRGTPEVQAGPRSPPLPPMTAPPPPSSAPPAVKSAAVGSAEAWAIQRVTSEDHRLNRAADAAATHDVEESTSSAIGRQRLEALGAQATPMAEVSSAGECFAVDQMVMDNVSTTSTKKSNLKKAGGQRKLSNVQFPEEPAQQVDCVRQDSGEHWSATGTGGAMSVVDLVDYIDNPGRRKSYADLMTRKMSVATVATQINHTNQREFELMEAYAQRTQELSEALEHDIVARRKSIIASRTTIQDWANSAEAALAVNKAKAKFMKLLGGEKGGEGTEIPTDADGNAKGWNARGEPWWKTKQREAKESPFDRRRKEQWARVLPAEKIDYQQLLSDQEQLQHSVDASDGVYRKMLEKHEEIQETLRRNLSMLLRVGMNFGGGEREEEEEDDDLDEQVDGADVAIHF